MKNNVMFFLDVLTKIFSIIIICIGVYTLFINLFHHNYINQSVIVSELDNSYTKYNENINLINNNLKKINKSNEYYNGINSCLNYLKSYEGINGIRVGQVLKPYDIYVLNSNFNNELYNRCWISSMSFISLEEHNNDTLGHLFSEYNRTIRLLVKNSDYVKKELKGNSSYQYRTINSKDMVRNDLVEQYNMVLDNYCIFSEVILDFSNFLTGGVNHG